VSCEATGQGTRATLEEQTSATTRQGQGRQSGAHQAKHRWRRPESTLAIGTAPLKAGPGRPKVFSAWPKGEPSNIPCTITPRQQKHHQNKANDQGNA